MRVLPPKKRAAMGDGQEDKEQVDATARKEGEFASSHSKSCNEDSSLSSSKGEAPNLPSQKERGSREGATGGAHGDSNNKADGDSSSHEQREDASHLIYRKKNMFSPSSMHKGTEGKESGETGGSASETVQKGCCVPSCRNEKFNASVRYILVKRECKAGKNRDWAPLVDKNVCKSCWDFYRAHGSLPVRRQEEKDGSKDMEGVGRLQSFLHKEEGGNGDAGKGTGRKGKEKRKASSDAVDNDIAASDDSDHVSKKPKHGEDDEDTANHAHSSEGSREDAVKSAHEAESSHGDGSSAKSPANDDSVVKAEADSGGSEAEGLDAGAEAPLRIHGTTADGGSKICTRCSKRDKTVLIIPCMCLALCSECADLQSFVQSDVLPFSACPLCTHVMKKPFFIECQIAAKINFKSIEAAEGNHHRESVNENKAVSNSE